MATQTFDELPENEKADFLQTCTEAGLAAEDFNVSFTQEIAGDCDVKTCGRSVIVQLGAIARAYEGAEDLPWTAGFDEDVKANVFS
jgi:hypothetical protein